MDLTFKGLPQLLKRFPDHASAREYLEAKIWQGTPVCPHCQSDRWHKLKREGKYRCGKCRKDYTVTVGTIYHNSQIPLNIWFAAMYLVTSHKKGISSHQLAKDLHITQKSAWHLLHRLRELVRVKEPQILSGTVEVDETYMGRKFKSEIKPKDFDRTPTWPQIERKGCVFGMIERNGKVVIKVFERKDSQGIKEIIKKTVASASKLYTDNAYLYRNGLEEYVRESVKHGQREYVRGDVHTNNIENFWGLMKRGLYGIYHQVSYKHLQRYCDEYSFRFNNRKIPDTERFLLSLNDINGRLSYKKLVHGHSQKEKRNKKEDGGEGEQANQQIP